MSESTDLSAFQGNANGFVSGQVCLWAHYCGYLLPPVNSLGLCPQISAMTPPLGKKLMYVLAGAWVQWAHSDIPDAAWGQVDVSPEFMTEKDFSGLKKTTYSPQTTYTAETCYAAKWTQSKGSFTVSYDWNGATFLNAIEPQTVASGDSVPLYIIKDDFGHTLKGWATEDGA